MRKNHNFSSILAYFALLAIAFTTCLAVIFVIPSQDVIAAHTSSTTVYLQSSGNNRAHFTINCYADNVTSASGTADNGASVSCSISGTDVSVNVSAASGSDFSSVVTVTVSVDTDGEYCFLNFDRAAIDYSYVAPATATPTPRPTSTPTPTTVPAATTAPTTSAVVTEATAPVVTDPAATEVIAPSVQETAAESTETTTATPTPTPASSEETEASEMVEETSVIAPVVATSAVTTDETTVEETGTPTPTPHVNPTVAATNGTQNNDKGGFPWWIIIIIALLGAGGYRYSQLKKDGKDNKEILYDFIPGGIIGTAIEKVHPTPVSVSNEPAPDVDANGYLKKSNTAAIRPVYSNIPVDRADSAAKTTEKKVVENKAPEKKAAPVAKPVSSTPAQKAPIKRPKELSSNRAQAMANPAQPSASDEKKTVTSTSKTSSSAGKKVPVNQRPPVKRPKKTTANYVPTKVETPEPEKVSTKEVKKNPKPARKREIDTMNRPDADRLNENATSSAASIVFKKEAQEGPEFAPAIATAILPPVQEKKERVSPFKPIANPVQDSTDTVTKVNEPTTPAIARFTEIPLVEKPASPFKPISENPENTDNE